MTSHLYSFIYTHTHTHTCLVVGRGQEVAKRAENKLYFLWSFLLLYFLLTRRKKNLLSPKVKVCNFIFLKIESDSSNEGKFLHYSCYNNNNGYCIILLMIKVFSFFLQFKKSPRHGLVNQSQLLISSLLASSCNFDRTFWRPCFQFG